MKTKHFFQNLKTATLMVALSLSMSSCQELVESIFGSSIDNPVPSEPTSQTPTQPDTGIVFDMGTMNKQIAELETRIAILEAQDMGVEQFKKDLEALKAEVAKWDGKPYVDDEIKNLQYKIDSLSEAIRKASSVMITGVILQETLDCVVGTINLPGFTPAFLAAYVGENKTGMPEFPISGKEYNVDPSGNYLKPTELPQDINGNFDEDAIIGNSGKNAYLTNGIGNAGTLYFTITPRKVDPSILQFNLINSMGDDSHIILDAVLKSDHLITYAIGKHGNGLTRGDDNNPFSVPYPVNVENEKTFLYEAKVTVALDAIEKMHSDTRYYYNKWDAGYELTGANQSADANAKNMFGRYQYLAEAVKSKTVTKELQASLIILQDFYNGVYSERYNIRKHALKVSWDDGAIDVISGFDISPVIINPLNFKQLFLLDNINIPWSFKNYEKALGDIAKTIQSKASSSTSVTLKSVSIDGTQPKMTLTAGDADIVVDITEEVYNAINNGMELSTLENMVNSILHPYQTISASSNTMTRVNNFLDKIGASVMIGQGGNVAWNGVEPILLFENMEGISQLHSNMTINGSGPTTFIMTSLTEEYIVPAYRKYIAIVQNGSVLKYYSVDGKEKIAQLNLPIGDSEIVYQVSDFYGNVVTKRYPVTRKQ